jgi:hypothetical protein
VGLQPNTTNYVFLGNSGLIEANTIGFPAAVYPIAVATTSGSGVVTLTDARPDVLMSVGTGPTGGADGILAVNTSQTLSFGSNTNLIVAATAGAGRIALTLPPASSYPGQAIKVVKIDSGTGSVIIPTQLGSTSNYALTSQWQYVVAESFGTGWAIVNHN